MKTVPLINLFLRQTCLFSLCTYYIISAKTNQEICRIISDFQNLCNFFPYKEQLFLFETHFTWHTAQRKNKSNQLLYSFSEITAAIFSFPPKYKLFDCTFFKKGNKNSLNFFFTELLVSCAR